MSFLKRFEKREKVLPNDECWAKFREELPTLSGLIIGEMDEQSKVPIPGGTLMIFRDDAKLKWTFHHKLSRTTLFGTFPDQLLALEDVELALLEGRYEEKHG